jgi:hypothetical protein
MEIITKNKCYAFASHSDCILSLGVLKFVNRLMLWLALIADYWAVSLHAKFLRICGQAPRFLDVLQEGWDRRGRSLRGIQHRITICIELVQCGCLLCLSLGRSYR